MGKVAGKAEASRREGNSIHGALVSQTKPQVQRHSVTQGDYQAYSMNELTERSHVAWVMPCVF